MGAAACCRLTLIGVSGGQSGGGALFLFFGVASLSCLAIVPDVDAEGAIASGGGGGAGGGGGGIAQFELLQGCGRRWVDDACRLGERSLLTMAQQSNLIFKEGMENNIEN